MVVYRVKLVKRLALVVALLIIIQMFGSVRSADLQPTSSLLHEDIREAIQPNQRESIDDCHLRYYKYGKNYLSKPISQRPAFLREFAHMAAIGWTKADGTIGWHCGGTLIWENYILTAAHCTADYDNAEPDVVRLGDLNLYDDTDDQYAQQLKIVEIIRHPEYRFSARYHDLALLKLERNVVLNDTVAPACLWNDEEVPFSTMEAAGWGATGYGEKNTPILLKVSLGVVEKADCEKHYRFGEYKLKMGLQSYHLCAGDPVMDTCPGDSGGPLQIKLLHNYEITPFLVAVTSFGKACGQSVPGVYTKVSSYIPWIRSELAKRAEKIEEWSFNPYACSRRYLDLREYEDDVMAYVHEDGVGSYEFSNAHMGGRKSSQTVRIHWPAGQQGPDNCYGIVIDEDTVLTMARCAVFGRLLASYVVWHAKVHDVASVHQHPKYENGSVYNDIALLKVKNRFQLSTDYAPACIWSAKELPNERVYVAGQIKLESYIPAKRFNPDIYNIAPRVDIQRGENCTAPEERFTRGLTQEHMCFGNKIFLVPETCELQIGAPLYREVWRMERYLDHVYGLNLLGKDCGFGRSAVATRVAYHLDWLTSVLLPNHPNQQDMVLFLDGDLDELDHCSGIDGRAGLCVQVDKCPRIAYDIAVKRNVRFCGTGSLVCCPYYAIKNQTAVSSTAKELDECESRYEMFHNELMGYPYRTSLIDRFHNMVHIGWRKGENDTDWLCVGTLITRSIVVTSALCVLQKSLPTVINVGEGNPQQSLALRKEADIAEIIVHPDYHLDFFEYDLALVRLKENIVPTAHKYPICLWQNGTHTPFLLHRMVFGDDGETFSENYPQYDSDCKRHIHRFDHLQLCTDIDDKKAYSVHGAPIVWHRYNAALNITTPYLVGVVGSTHPEQGVALNTRISSFIDWMKSVI